MSCELCNYPIGEKHRILPGEWGGEYVEDNVVILCPNHHKAIHKLMRWLYTGGMKSAKSKAAVVQFAHDFPLWRLWMERVKPVVDEKLRSEGRWHETRGLDVDFPGGTKDQKRAWRERADRHMKYEDALEMIQWDGDYIAGQFDLRSESDEERFRRANYVTRNDILAHPFVARRDDVYKGMLLGYLTGAGLLAASPLIISVNE